jgi:hypothetical protein
MEVAGTRDYTEAWKMQTKICGFYFIWKTKRF